ncbi:MAG: ATPase, T2SS/T4P/T4SS family [Myxococcota bacterium]|nr:ATPase, T2SS/T4P/T4SS family [Myxococcota bacterium]
MSDAQIRQFLRRKLVMASGLTPDQLEEGQLKERIGSLLDELVERGATLSGALRKRVTSQTLDDLLGLGPLEPLMRNDDVTEIMVNGPADVFVEFQGRKARASRAFDDDAHLAQILERLLLATGTRLDESRPFADLALPNGSRINVVIPPAVTRGPHLTVRKFLRRFRVVEDFTTVDSLDERMATFLAACVRTRRNMLLGGASGAGKTTLMEVLGAHIDETERVVLIEDTPELQLPQPNIARLLTRPPNVDGRGEVTIRDLFRNSLRMRPSRILLGEIRGREALEYLQALNSGHRGSLAVIHAASPEEALLRLENLVPYSGVPIPVQVVREQIARGLDLAIQLEQLPDGQRKVTRIAETAGLDDDGRVVLRDLFLYVDEGVDDDGTCHGHFEATGTRPRFIDDFDKAAVSLPDDLFDAPG